MKSNKTTIDMCREIGRKSYKAEENEKKNQGNQALGLKGLLRGFD